MSTIASLQEQNSNVTFWQQFCCSKMNATRKFSVSMPRTIRISIRLRLYHICENCQSSFTSRISTVGSYMLELYFGPYRMQNSVTLKAPDKAGSFFTVILPAQTDLPYKFLHYIQGTQCPHGCSLPVLHIPCCRLCRTTHRI